MANVAAVSYVVMGYDSLDKALKEGSIAFEGYSNYVRQVSTWLYLQGERRYLSGLAPTVPGGMAGG